MWLLLLGLAVQYRCPGGETVEVKYSGKRAEVQVAGRPKIRLNETGTGKYSDGYTVLSRRGESVMVEAGSVKLQGCVEAGALTGRWRVVEIQGKPLEQGVKAPYVEFLTEGRLAGFGGCNRFGGSYKRSGNQLEIGALAATKMACVGRGMEVEDRFFAIFAGRLYLQSKDQKLELRDDNNVIVLRLQFQP